MAIGAALALGNVAFWLVWAILTPALPSAYFADRDARVTSTEHGIQYRLVTDVDPMLILAERPLAYPLDREPGVVLAGLVVNLPAFIAGGIATASLEAAQVPPHRSIRRAAWVGTCVFACVSTAQWLLVGYAIARRRASQAK